MIFLTTDVRVDGKSHEENETRHARASTRNFTHADAASSACKWNDAWR
jgi:hypothetical protein